MAFGFAAVLLEGCLQFSALRGLGHFREGAQDLLFRVVDVLERVVKQIVQRLRFFCHDILH